MSLYIKCPDNPKQQIYVEEVVRILRRDYGLTSLMISTGNTRHYFLPIPKGLDPRERATIEVSLNRLAERDREIKTGIFNKETETLRRLVEEGKIKL